VKSAGSISSAARAAKNGLLPAGTHLRKVGFGLARGTILPLDFSRHTRLYLGLYEIELNRYLRAFCTPGILAFDVGAQIGYDALVLARLTKGQVISFEADPELAAMLLTTFAANPDVGRLISGRHAVVAASSHASGTTVALDDVAYREGHVPGMMKIDIDGGELDALRGSRRILREARPHVIVETHSAQLEQACGSLLVEMGYRPRIVHQRRVWPDLRPVEHNRWLVAAGNAQVPLSAASAA